MVAHRLPVVPTLCARARRNPLLDFLLDDVRPIPRYPRLRIDQIEDVLEDRLLVVDEPAVGSIELPQNAGLADREDEFLRRDVDEDALEDLVEIERFGGRVLVVPHQRAGVDVERERGRCVEHRIEHRRPATRGHPGLGLCHAPVRQIEIRIVAADDPRLAALAERVRQLAPRVAPWFSRLGDGVELPLQLASGRIVGADEAAIGSVSGAPGHPLNHLTARDDGTARCAEPLRPVGHDGLPDECAVARIERDEPGVGGRDDHLVLIDREIAHRALPELRHRPDFVLPDQVARGRVQRLHDVAGVDEIQRAIVHKRLRLIRADIFLHRPDPRELQILHIETRDLGERAVVPRLVIPPGHEPVAWRGVPEHVVGHRREVLHFSGDGEASGHRLRATERLSRGHLRGGHRHRPLRLTRGNGANGHRGRRREGLRARHRAVRLKNERRDAECLLRTQVCRASRHRRVNQLEQLARGPATPCTDEAGADKLGRFVSAAHIRPMAAGAALVIDPTARGCLGRGKDGCGRCLLAGENRARQGAHGHKQDEGTAQPGNRAHRRFSYTESEPQRLPSGVFLL